LSQGDAGSVLVQPDVAPGAFKECECPKCGLVFETPRGVSCRSYRCPECGVPLVGKEVQSEKSVSFFYVPVVEHIGLHKNHKIESIEVPGVIGVEARYCVDCRQILAFAFPSDQYTEEEAKRWVEEFGDSVRVTKVKNVREGREGICISRVSESVDSKIHYFDANREKGGEDVVAERTPVVDEELEESKGSPPEEVKKVKAEEGIEQDAPSFEKDVAPDTDKPKVIKVEKEESNEETEKETVKQEEAEKEENVFSVLEEGEVEKMSEQEKSEYTDFIKECMKQGKTMKQCALEWKEQKKSVEEPEVEKEYPSPGEKYPNIPAGSFKKIFDMLDKLIKGSEDENLKKALQTIKAALSHAIGGSYPYPKPKNASEEKRPAVSEEVVEDLGKDLAELQREVELRKEEELLKAIRDRDERIEELKKQVGEIKELIEKRVPIRKGVVAEPEKREKDEEITKSKEFEEATPGDKLRMLLKKSFEKN